jgi:hypothetical protein
MVKDGNIANNILSEIKTFDAFTESRYKLYKLKIYIGIF